MPMIEVKGLTRNFEYYEKSDGLKGSVKNLFRRSRQIRHAVSEVTFSVEKGEIVGFIGPNGAGKTTTLKMLSGILHPSGGHAVVNGFIPWERKDAFKRTFTLISGQKSQLFPDLPAKETLYINKCIYEITDAAYKETVSELAAMLGVSEFLNIQVRRLSLGQKMKLELIAALLHKPSVIFLDEPTIGLDIVSQTAIREYLKEYNRKTGATIILTSHYTKDIEELCDHTIIINHGKKVYDGTIAGLKRMEKNAKILTLTFAESPDPDRLVEYGELKHMDGNKVSLEIQYDRLSEIIPRILSTNRLVDFSIEDLSLEKSIESIFLAE